jgi:hypothetical protein
MVLVNGNHNACVGWSFFSELMSAVSAIRAELEKRSNLMKVFISWSGSKSQKMAEQLRKWLPYIIQPVKPFLSSGDIRKGARWSDVLSQELKDTRYGIICITRQNIISPWLNFEAGALSKLIGQSCVSPLLFDVEPSKLQGPLSQFQATVFDEHGDDFFGLISSINNNLPAEQQVPPDILRDTYYKWWPDLSADIKDASKTKTDETETGYKWLYSVADLKSTEGHAELESVWVINPEPLKDWHLLVDIVQKNLAQGILYEFIVPSNRVNDLKGLILNEFDWQVKDSPSHMDLTRLCIKSIEKDEYKSLAVTHYRVLNFKSDELSQKRIFFEVPIAPCGYWVETEGEAIDGFYMRFADMRKRAKLEEVSNPTQLAIGEDVTT